MLEHLRGHCNESHCKKLSLSQRPLSQRAKVNEPHSLEGQKATLSSNFFLRKMQFPLRFMKNPQNKYTPNARPAQILF